MTKEEKIRVQGEKLKLYFAFSSERKAEEIYEEVLDMEKVGRIVRAAMLRGELNEEQEEKYERRLEHLFLLVTEQDINKTNCFFCWEDGESFLKTEDFLIFDKGILVPEFKED